MLTWTAYAADRADPAFVQARAEAASIAERVSELAGSPDGIPAAGGLAMLRGDPATQGPIIFEANCSVCHLYNGHNGLGRIPDEEPSASDLGGFGSREWLTGLLDPNRINTPEYFGNTEHTRGRMARFVQRGVAGFDDDQRAALRNVVLAVSAEAGLPSQAAADEADRDAIQEGRVAISSEAINCTRCHTYADAAEGDVAPVLTGWASRQWIMGMLRNPSHPLYYADNNDRMPAFGDEGILSEAEIGLVADWLRGDWYLPDAN